MLRPDGEEEFVIVAAVESQGKRIELSCAGFGNSRTGNSLRFEAGSHGASLTQPRQICRKSVGEIQHRGGQPAFGEPSACGKPRLRIKMLAQVRVANFAPAGVLLHEAKAILGFAEAPGDKEGVAGAGAAAENGAAVTAFSDDGEIDENPVSASGVAACCVAVEVLRSGAQAAQEIFKPPSGDRNRQSQAQEKAAGCGSHGG